MLEGLDDFPCDRGPEGRPARPRDLAHVIAAFPAGRRVIDAQEPRIHRPGGLGESLSPGVPGPANDVRRLRASGRLKRLAKGEAARPDKG